MNDIRHLSFVGLTRLARVIPVLFLPILLRGQASDTAVELAGLKNLSLEELANTEVTSVTLYPSRLQDSASAIQVITSGDLSCSTAPNLPEALRLADNLDIAQKNPHDWAISARGFDSNLGDKMLVLIDGRTVYTPLFSGVFWNAQDYLLTDLDRIEVISGPGGTLWGANAVNGVINVTTKSARDTQGGYLEAGVGDDSQQYAGLRYGGVAAPNVYFRAYGKFLREGDAEYPSGAGAHDSWSQTQGGFRLDAMPAGGATLTFQGDAYGDDLNVATGGDARMQGENLLGRWSRNAPDGTGLSLQLYFNRDYLADPFPASPYQPFGYLRDNLTTYDIALQDRIRPLPGQELAWGAGVRYIADDVLQPAPNFTFYPPKQDEPLYSAFLQDQVELAPALYLTGGTKVEHNIFTGFEWEPNLRLRWNFSTRQMAWAAVSRAVRTPSRFDRDLREPAVAPILISGGANFVSETLIAYELGYRAQLGDRLYLSLSNFYNDYERLRSVALTPGTVFPLHYENGNEGRSWGTELSASLAVTDLCQVHLGYDLLREHVWVAPGQFDFLNALDETADPENQFFLRASLPLPMNLELDPALRCIDRLTIDNGGQPATVPAYTELDARLGWRATSRIEISVNGRNLLHPRHDEFAVPTATAEEIPRTVYGRIAYSF